MTFYAKQSDIPKGQWWIIVSDNSDQAGAGGYHDLTDEGKPLGKVFAKTDMQSGSSWTVAFSHELLNRHVLIKINPNHKITPYLLWLLSKNK